MFFVLLEYGIYYIYTHYTYRYTIFIEFSIDKKTDFRHLTLIREFLGPSPSVFSGKKYRIIAGDGTVGIEETKIKSSDRVSVGLM